ncbi:MAG: DUF2232 domain-containing protein [Clostridium sp.]
MSIKKENKFPSIQVLLFGVLAFLIVPMCAVSGSVNLFGIMVVPIIIAIIYLKFDFIKTGILLVISTIISAVSINPMVSIQALILFGSIGIVLGYCFKNIDKPYKSFVILVVTTVIAILAITIVYMVVEKMSFTAMAQQYVNLIMNKVEYLRELYVTAGISDIQMQSLDIIKEVITTKNILLSVPGIMVSLAIYSSIINYIIGKNMIHKIGYNCEQLKFSEIYVTNLLGALFIALICIGIILSFKFAEFGEFLKLGSFGILKMLLMLNGLASFAYMFINKSNKSKKFTFTVITISVILGAVQIYTFIGFIEMMLDFRKLDPFSLTKNRKSEK